MYTYICGSVRSCFGAWLWMLIARGLPIPSGCFWQFGCRCRGALVIRQFLKEGWARKLWLCFFKEGGYDDTANLVESLFLLYAF